MLHLHEAPTDDFDFADGVDDPDYTVGGCDEFDDDDEGDWVDDEVDASDPLDIEYDR